MDTSKERILMCEKAEEIQSKVIHNLTGLFYGIDTRFYTDISDNIFFCVEYSHPSKADIFLPRRAQLHRLSGLSWWDFDEKCKEIATVICGGERMVNPLISKEQAGIMVVMKVKHNKQWTGKEWKLNESR